MKSPNFAVNLQFQENFSRRLYGHSRGVYEDV